MKRVFIAGCFLTALACSKRNTIPPVSGIINGKPAVSLYGASNKPTDYALIDTADKKISYDGIVFAYLYNSPTTIYIMNPSTPAAQAGLTFTSTGITLTINATYTLTFGSTIYTSR